MQQLKLYPSQVEWKSPFPNLDVHEYLKIVTSQFQCIREKQYTGNDTDNENSDDDPHHDVLSTMLQYGNKIHI